MKLPSKRRMYCKYCKKHTIHEVIIVKPGKRGKLTAGSRRKLWNIEHGYGSTPYPMFEHAKRKVKNVKRYNVIYRCTVCKKAQVQRRGKKAKKVEIIAK
ncbi:MAG: 50S ribosomal protein L44e [Candidatus Rehaiarchaeum fermentans]|nr:50S ribosomal protein L44e [Candidatus Rehaiarchaeum fermentans]MCW1292736.1 50S ribosomal protein L44e [Candidatus Rehaiarchaeum fermentans]MCW1292874.1 50S ribosomal protein L44e [Candidatus Rehaiarchaeum fermentans]MCW1293755.1 50S ribosomal protein L44e [Candidatus Rehaiarchaeum fermentans]MCW1297089.1 50S ribosomal protein L44e [Candidatus Rehaiarchaeum fermentans]